MRTIRIEKRLGDASNPAVFSLELVAEDAVGMAAAVYRVDGQLVHRTDFEIAMHMCGGSAVGIGSWLLTEAP